MRRHFDRRLALLFAAALMVSGGAAAGASASKPVPDDMSMGNPKAAVTVVEYASASCPHCARFNNNVLPAFKKKYVDTGKVRFVFREFLTQPVEIAEIGFMLARCAGDKKYFSTIDTFFRGQDEMYRTRNPGPLINSVGAKAGLSPAQIEACLSDEAARKALDDRVNSYAVNDQIEYTPTFVINGVKLPEMDHEVGLADLDLAIGPLLSKSGRP